jgi:hypothetical protein
MHPKQNQISWEEENIGKRPKKKNIGKRVQ